MVTLIGNYSHLLRYHNSTDDGIFVKNATVHRNRRIDSARVKNIPDNPITAMTRICAVVTLTRIFFVLYY